MVGGFGTGRRKKVRQTRAEVNLWEITTPTKIIFNILSQGVSLKGVDNPDRYHRILPN